MKILSLPFGTSKFGKYDHETHPKMDMKNSEESASSVNGWRNNKSVQKMYCDRDIENQPAKKMKQNYNVN
jgi:hypothetical protein